MSILCIAVFITVVEALIINKKIHIGRRKKDEYGKDS